MSKLEILKKLYQKQSEIANYERKLPEGRIEKKKILYTEVTDDIWNILTEDDHFKKSVDDGFANIGGFEVRRGSNFIVHDQIYIKEKSEPYRRTYKKAGRMSRK